jgi:hypothetical protein
MALSCCDVVVRTSWWMRLMNTAEGARARVSRWKTVTQADGQIAYGRGEKAQARAECRVMRYTRCGKRVARAQGMGDDEPMVLELGRRWGGL